MNVKLRKALLECETDIDGALQRFCDNEELYLSYIDKFPEEPTMVELGKAIENHNWDEAFTAAHALKGLAGNLGLIPLFHATGELVVLLRSGRFDELDNMYNQTVTCYETLVSAIQNSNNQE